MKMYPKHCSTSLINYLNSITKLVIKFLLTALTAESHVTRLEGMLRRRACGRIPGRGRGGGGETRSEVTPSVRCVHTGTPRCRRPRTALTAAIRRAALVNFVLVSEGTHAQT